MMIATRNRNRCSGQALVEFVLLLTVMILCCVEIYQLIEWSSDGIKAQAASWFVVRGQTFDFRHNNTSENEVTPLLQQSVFTNHEDFSADLSLRIGKHIWDPVLYSFDILGLPSLDISMVRQGTVKVYTPDFFEGLPSPLNLAENVSVFRNGHHYFKSEASSMVYASWTSAAQNHDFDKDAANSNWNTRNNGDSVQKKIAAEKAKLEKEAEQWDEKAAADYQAWETEKDATKKQQDWQAYEQATAEAAKLRDQAAHMVDPTNSGD
jgi:hypothetical protein